MLLKDAHEGRRQHVGRLKHNARPRVKRGMNKYRNGLWPMQYVFLIRSSAGGKKYVTRRARDRFYFYC